MQFQYLNTDKSAVEVSSFVYVSNQADSGNELKNASHNLGYITWQYNLSFN